MCYVTRMNDRFADKATSEFYESETCQKAWQSFAAPAARKLDMVYNAARLDDLRIPPSNNLEALKGERKGSYSIRIAGNSTRYRITFTWRDGKAQDIRIEDYHHG